MGPIVSNGQNYIWEYYNPYTGHYEYIISSSDPATIYTPNNSPVSVSKWKNTDWSQNTKNDYIGYCQTRWGGGNRLIFESEATVKYNCHAYAWDGNTGVFLIP